MNIKHLFEHAFETALIGEIETRGQIIEAQPGQTVIEIGQAVRHFPIVLEGSIKVTRLDESGRELLLYYLGANEGCAMTFTCCMQQFPSEIQAVVEEKVQLLMIPTTVMDEWLVKYPSWKAFVMRTIRTRFVEMLKAIDQLAFQNLDQRLVGYLKEKARIFQSTVLDLSHQQIADELATSRVVISRLLKKLENDKRVLLYRNQIKILKGM